MSNKSKLTYFETEDVLHILLSDEKEAGSVELSPNITVELNEAGEMIGVEILEASEFLKNTVLESMQGRILLDKKAA
jgi:uncharacterized protein YuzE